jgi:GDP-4-dehydro-6-deoxy-D-mannose reductase
MPTWLVTGGSGFLGRHLLATLEGLGPSIQVVALGRNRPPGVPPERFETADLEGPSAVARALAEVRPDVVFHLAGRTPPASPEALFRSNVRATDHVVAGLRSLERPVRLVVAGSAAELGPVPVDRLPAVEALPCRPADAYGLSKWFATKRALAAGGAIETVAARVFNPIGPGLPTSQAFGRFAAALASDQASNPSDGLILRVGDLDARRDFIDARDVAAALVALAVRGTPGQVYHVGTGGSHRVGDGLDLLIALAGRPVEVVEQVFARRGPSDSRADTARLRADTGWSPRYSLETSLADLWAEARSQALHRRGQPPDASPSARHWPKAG